MSGSADPVSFTKRGGGDSAIKLPDFSDNEFDEVKYINEHFPNEQSLANIEDVIDELERKIASYDDNLQKVRTELNSLYCKVQGFQHENLFRLSVSKSTSAESAKKQQPKRWQGSRS